MAQKSVYQLAHKSVHELVYRFLCQWCASWYTDSCAKYYSYLLELVNIRYTDSCADLCASWYTDFCANRPWGLFITFEEPSYFSLQILLLNRLSFLEPELKLWKYDWDKLPMWAFGIYNFSELQIFFISQRILRKIIRSSE